jgi:ABC-type lipoprotein release transport system permease subunit
LPGPVLIVVAIATVVLAALAGIVPAVMAYRTSVARNLRPIG